MIVDALDGIGHACGHNLIATASVAGGLATAEIMKKHQLNGKVVMFGTPAEEGELLHLLSVSIIECDVSYEGRVFDVS